jgi:hypothetical protein
VNELLEGLTKGYDVYTCGSSSGGYAAVCIGCLLNAKAIYNFSGQFSLEEESVEYSCAMKSHFRKSGNQKTGRQKSSYASLLA